MMTGLSDHPGRVPYGLEDRTLSTLSHHFSPRPPALRFHGDGICGVVGDPGSRRWPGRDASADRGRVGVSAGGAAVASLRNQLGAERVVCFGDSDNDLSMFELADESYAPDNAADHVKSAATCVIGHHDEDGIARFLRERFDLVN